MNVGLDAVMKPASNVVTRRPPTMNHLVMTPASAQIARPALSAWLLAMHMTLRQPSVLAPTVNLFTQAAHECARIVNKTVACVEIAVGGHSQIAGSCSTRIRPMRSGMQFAQRSHHV